MNRNVMIAGALLVVPLIAVLLLNIDRDPSTIRSPLIRKPAPDFELRAVGGGEMFSITGLRGKPVVINFWATWCIPCFEEHKVLTAAARELGDAVQFLGIVYQDQELAAHTFLERHGSSYPSLVDPGSRTAIAYGIYGVPETYFIDAQGQIAAKHVGPLSRELLAAYLRKVRGETS